MVRWQAWVETVVESWSVLDRVWLRVGLTHSDKALTRDINVTSQPGSRLVFSAARNQKNGKLVSKLHNCIMYMYIYIIVYYTKRVKSNECLCHR